MDNSVDKYRVANYVKKGSIDPDPQPKLRVEILQSLNIAKQVVFEQSDLPKYLLGVSFVDTF